MKERTKDNIVLTLASIVMILMAWVLLTLVFGMGEAEAAESCWGFTCEKVEPPPAYGIPVPPRTATVPWVPVLAVPYTRPAYPSLQFVLTPQGSAVIHQVNPGLTVTTGPQKTVTCVTVGRVVSCQ